MLAVSDLHKSFGAVQAVDGVSLEIARGEAFGLLGPNGAGKTTTIHMIVGVLSPDSGSVTLGEGDTAGPPTDPVVRRDVGIAPQSLSLYEEMSGNENLSFFGKLYGLRGKPLRERIDWALEFAGLTDRRGDLVKTYSGGMQRRLNLATALLHEPKVVFCDEPTVGVDPQSRNHIFESIERLKADGLTIIYTTHYMEEAQRLCDRVAIMDAGKILAVDTVDGLIEAHGGQSSVTAELAGDFEGDLPGERDGRTIRIETDKPLEEVADLAARGVGLQTLHVERPDLEAVFLALTGRSLRDE